MSDKLMFSYEDFVMDLSRYLKTHEKEYLGVAFDGYSAYVDEIKLIKKLSDFWLNLTE